MIHELIFTLQTTVGESMATCQICGDKIGLEENGRDVFVACHECGFPICRPCYDYERGEGHHSCPQCHTHYNKPLKSIANSTT